MWSHAWKLGLGGFCAASGLALHSWTAPPADCEAVARSRQQHGAAADGAASTAAKLAALEDWLRQQGADIDAIQFKQSLDMDGGRYGVYAGDGMRQRAARGFWGTVTGWAGMGRNAAITIASFPLASTLTVANLARDAQQGPVLRDLMEREVVDERTAIILHLAVERQRLRQHGGGSHGGSQAWLVLLPASFSTTLFFSELEMQWLRGTTLHKATRLRQQTLRSTWARLEPVARKLVQLAGLEGLPSLDDWVWANSVFWSRAIAFPSPAANGSGGVEMQEGIVPGLDFCNHAASSPCKWTVFGGATHHGSAQPDAVRLICPRWGVPRRGQGVTIDYGGKSNEELLFLYGFALPHNEAEVLTLMFPLPPPSEWDDQLAARLALLQRRGLRPQVHLPAANLAAAASGGSGGKGGSLQSGLALPEDVAETLEVFVLEPQQVRQQLKAGEEGSDGSGSGSSCGGGEAEQSGMRMALLTTLVRLLELKAAEMEGQEGTGPLEQDEQLLAMAGTSLSRNQRHALLYRMGQKRLARDYLAHAKRLLQREMAHLQQLQEGSGQ